MIFDTLNNLNTYTVIPRLKEILQFLNENNPHKLRDGDIEIDGRDLFVKVLRYLPKDAKENNFEAHKFYTDVQVVLGGREKMQFTCDKQARPLGEYKKATDTRFFSDSSNISEVVIKNGEFIVFFPGELHKPGCVYKASKNRVLKLVFKVKTIKCRK